MSRVVDCLADTTVYQNESPDLCAKECERLGGKSKNYFVFSDGIGLTENTSKSTIVNVDKKPAIGELFG